MGSTFKKLWIGLKRNWKTITNFSCSIQVNTASILVVHIPLIAKMNSTNSSMPPSSDNKRRTQKIKRKERRSRIRKLVVNLAWSKTLSISHPDEVIELSIDQRQFENFTASEPEMTGYRSQPWVYCPRVSSRSFSRWWRLKICWDL